MGITQKCQYALRALLALSKRFEQGPAKISDIAEEQHIPSRFLEVILNELKQGGFTESRRGKEGGYYLRRRPQELTVGEVIRFVQGPLGPVECVYEDPENVCALKGDCVFLPLWQRVEKAVADIYDNTTFQDLLDEDQRRQKDYVPNFTI